MIYWSCAKLTSTMLCNCTFCQPNRLVNLYIVWLREYSDPSSWIHFSIKRNLSKVFLIIPNASYPYLTRPSSIRGHGLDLSVCSLSKNIYIYARDLILYCIILNNFSIGIKVSVIPCNPIYTFTKVHDVVYNNSILYRWHCAR